MASNVVEGNNDIFQCQICIEEMVNTQPRLFLCGHTFCSICLKQILRYDGFECPTCRFKVNETDICKIPINFSLIKMKDIESDMVKLVLQSDLCKFCLLKGKKLKLKCTVCDLNMCDGCSSKHESLAAFKNHTVILSRHLSQDTCRRHGKNINFYAQIL